MTGAREFCFRKAIGWVVREASKGRPDLVVDFLLEHLGTAPGQTLREGSRYLPRADRKALMRLCKNRSRR